VSKVRIAGQMLPADTFYMARRFGVNCVVTYIWPAKAWITLLRRSDGGFSLKLSFSAHENTLPLCFHVLSANVSEYRKASQRIVCFCFKP